MISVLQRIFIRGKDLSPAQLRTAYGTLCGMVGMMLVLKCNLLTAFLEGCVVFLPGDLCKAVAAALLAAALKKALPKTVLA